MHSACALATILILLVRLRANDAHCSRFSVVAFQLASEAAFLPSLLREPVADWKQAPQSGPSARLDRRTTADQDGEGGTERTQHFTFSG